eukprot:276923_1
MTDRLVILGYIREIETQITLTIPNDIVILVQKFMMKYIIFGVGRNRLGELGLGNDNLVTTHTRLLQLEDLLPNINNIYCNRRGIMVKTAQNELFVSGDLPYGHGINTASYTFAPFNAAGAISLCSKGPENNNHTFILSMSGELYANGNNPSFGKYGDNQGFQGSDDVKLLQQIESTFCHGHEIIDIRCGNSHSVFLTQTGNIYCCGCNSSAECGFDCETVSLYVPTRICMENVGESTKMVAIAVGYCHNLAIDAEGRLIVWGNNFSGALGVGAQSNEDWSYLPMVNVAFHNQRIEQIECGYGHSLVRNRNGKCYAFGNNNNGSIGNGIAHDAYIFNPHLIEIPGDGDDYVVDGACGEQHTVLLSNKNNVITFGDNSYHQCSTWQDDTSKPYVVSKTNELHISESAFVEKVFCLNFETIIIINPMV